MIEILLQQALMGFMVKSIASFDDTLTRIPVLAEVTRGKIGKIAFSIGTLLALTVILIPVIFFSFLLELIPYQKYVIAGLIFILGVSVYLELFTPKKEGVEHKLIQPQTITNARFLKLIGIGFIISLITYLDDAITLVPLFLGNHSEKFFSIIGIYLAAILQIIAVIYFSRQIAQIKYRKEIASLALILLAALVWFGII